MKLLLCHNYYQQPGGEDRVFEDEARLLESRGHRVLRYTLHNQAIGQMGRWEVSRRALWNRSSYGELRALIRRERPCLMHCTNTFPLISPAAYYAARAGGIPVVQTLQNYRLLCPGGFFLRRDKVCEDCLGKAVPWPGVLHGCYRDQRSASAVVAGMLGMHRALRTWSRRVACYVVATHFARRKFLEAGFAPQRLAVKPNFVDPAPEPGGGDGNYALFVGRLAPEKGIDTLLAAWAQLHLRLPLKILGDGPLKETVRRFATGHAGVQWLGAQPAERVQQYMARARLLVVPSTWYEGLPKTIVESFSLGTPVVASRIGALEEIVQDGHSGNHFEPGNAEDLVAKVQSLLDEPQRLARMRHAARRQFEQQYTAETNYRTLMAIYQQVLDAAGKFSFNEASP